MSFIVIECFGGAECAIIATDRNGNNLVFDTKEEAVSETLELQDGRIFEI